MPVVAAVLFDLDGTLVDCAPDLAGTLNDMRLERGLAPWPMTALRHHSGSGARGLLGDGFQSSPLDAGTPLLEAVRQLRCRPTDCVYVGDDLRDIAAGRAAGMRTLVAGWGYGGAAPPLLNWGAGAVLMTSNELLNWLDLP